MKKYNIKVIVPLLNKNYEMFVPNNILVGNLLYMLINSINDIDNLNIRNLRLYNTSNGECLNLDEFVFNTISNGATLVLA